MEDLTISEIVTGVKNDAMKEHKVVLIELLTNKVVDVLDSLKPEDAREVITLTLNQLHIEKKSVLINLNLILLSNLTISIPSCETFMEIFNSDKVMNEYFREVIENFLANNPQLEDVDELNESTDWITLDPWQNVASVLCNLCQIETGRKFILQQSFEYMTRLVLQIRSKNAVRRRGAVSSLRSCLFDKDIHWWVLYETKALVSLLSPLVENVPFTDKEKEGMDPTLWLQAENPDKKVEPETDIMKMCLECIILLCQRRGIREELKKRKVYYVVRNLDTKCEIETINETAYEIVQLLIMDEDPTVPVDTYENQSLGEGVIGEDEKEYLAQQERAAARKAQQEKEQAAGVDGALETVEGEDPVAAVLKVEDVNLNEVD